MSAIATTNPSESALSVPAGDDEAAHGLDEVRDRIDVAIARNQSTSMRFRGAFIDDMKRKMKSTGKSAWIDSPEPVRRAMYAPSIPKPPR